MFKAFEKATKNTSRLKVRPTLKEVCEIYMKFAEDVRVEEGEKGGMEMYFVIGITNNDGTIAEMLCPLVREMVNNRRKIMRELGAKFGIDARMGYFTSLNYVAFISEAWMSFVSKDDPDLGKKTDGQIMPSEDPNKMEVLIVNASDGRSEEVKAKKITKQWSSELNRIVVSLEEMDTSVKSDLKDGATEVDEERRTVDKNSLLSEFYTNYNGVTNFKGIPKFMSVELEKIKKTNLNKKQNYAQFQKEIKGEKGKNIIKFLNADAGEFTD